MPSDERRRGAPKALAPAWGDGAQRQGGERALAVVTGSSSGIGQAITLALLDQGWRVCGFDVSPPTIEHAGFECVRVDLCDGAAATAAAAKVGGASALVHAAGVLRVGPLGQLNADAGALMWRLHVEAVTRLADVLLPAMAAAGHGRVVLVGSRVALG